MKTIKRNWQEIKRMMLLSVSSKLGWVWYSSHIANGLSNHVMTSPSTGQLQYFVEKMPYYANIKDEKYLKFGCNLSDEQIDFIKNNRKFLNTIPQ